MNVSSPHIARTRSFVLAVVWSIVVLAACGGDGGDPVASVAAIPGLDGASEVPLVETEPGPNTPTHTWSHAYRVGDLPPSNVGRPTEQFMEDAHRDPDEAASLICLESGGSGGCGDLDEAGPHIIGETFGGSDVRAWAWIGVPVEAAAVQFTDQEGSTTWQRPASAYRLVIFPDTVADDPDGNCACRFDAIDADGEVIESVDVRTSSYIGD